MVRVYHKGSITAFAFMFAELEFDRKAMEVLEENIWRLLRGKMEIQSRGR